MEAFQNEFCIVFASGFASGVASPQLPTFASQNQTRKWKRFLLFFMRRRAQLEEEQAVLYALAYLQARTRNKLSKSALPSWKESAFGVLYQNGSDEDFIAVLSIPRAAFDELLAGFTENYYQIVAWRPGRAGRPPAFSGNVAFVLGLVLCFYTNSLELNSLCQLFGLAPSTCSRTLSIAERAFELTLAALPDARIAWPTFQKQEAWAELVRRKNPLLLGRWGFVDGKNYRVQTPGADDVQNAFYNGWLHAHLVTGCLCFG